MPFSEDQINRAKVRIHFREFVDEVKQAVGLLIPMPDKLLDSLPEQLDKYINSELERMGIRHERGLQGSGWTRI